MCVCVCVNICVYMCCYLSINTEYLYPIQLNID